MGLRLSQRAPRQNKRRVPRPRTRGTLRSRSDPAGHFCLCRLATHTPSASTRTETCIRVATQLHRGSPRDAVCAERAPQADARFRHSAGRRAGARIATERMPALELQTASPLVLSPKGDRQVADMGPTSTLRPADGLSRSSERTSTAMGGERRSNGGSLCSAPASGRVCSVCLRGPRPAGRRVEGRARARGACGLPTPPAAGLPPIWRRPSGPSPNRRLMLSRFRGTRWIGSR
jgi:hypothetical protein